MENKTTPLEERCEIVIVGTYEETIDFCVEQFIKVANAAINDHGFFTVALSGGSTPKAIFKKLTDKEKAKKIDFTKVYLFFGDERAVPFDDPESNYKMAMDAGFKSLSMPPEHIFPMKGTGDLKANAKEYEAAIKAHVPHESFDLVMLGMGDDGHTASLFPHTKALDIQDRLVVENLVPQKKTSRLTLTFNAINQAKMIVVYVLGKAKAEKIAQVLTSPFNKDLLPIQAIGTDKRPAIFVLDKEAASKLQGN